MKLNTNKVEPISLSEALMPILEEILKDITDEETEDLIHEDALNYSWGYYGQE